MALLNIDEARAYLEKEMEGVKNMFEGLPVTVRCEVSSTYNDTEEGNELVYMFGAISISTDQLDENEILFLSLNADVLYSKSNDLAVVDSDVLDDNRDALLARLVDIKERLAASKDVSATVREINGEIDKQLQDEYTEMLERLNASSKHNLKVALIATGVMLGIALVCILINLIF